MELVKGRRLNERFKIVGSLGTGDMGCVLLAEDNHREDSIVALKIAPPDRFLKGGAKEKLKEKILHIRSLTEGNFVKPLEFIEEEGFQAITLDYFESDDIKTVIGREKLSQVEIIHFLKQILDSLVVLHTNGIFHGHLTPADILINSAGELKISIGGGENFPEGSGLHPQRVKERRRATSPRKIQRGEYFEERNDIYSFGAICFELLANEGKGSGGIPKVFRKIIAKSTQYDGAERYEDVMTLRRAFERAQGSYLSSKTMSATMFTILFSLFMASVLGVLYLTALLLSPDF